MKIMSGRKIKGGKEDERGEKEEVDNSHNSRNLHMCTAIIG